MRYMAQPGAPPPAWQGPRSKEDQNAPRRLQPPMSRSRLMRVDEAAPSRHLINNRCQPIKIGAQAHSTSALAGERANRPAMHMRRGPPCRSSSRVPQKAG